VELEKFYNQDTLVLLVMSLTLYQILPRKVVSHVMVCLVQLPLEPLLEHSHVLPLLKLMLLYLL
jgi:hypothetical protein